jgi:hypothetical protein
MFFVEDDFDRFDQAVRPDQHGAAWLRSDRRSAARSLREVVDSSEALALLRLDAGHDGGLGPVISLTISRVVEGGGLRAGSIGFKRVTGDLPVSEEERFNGLQAAVRAAYRSSSRPWIVDAAGRKSRRHRIGDEALRWLEESTEHWLRDESSPFLTYRAVRP